VASATILALVAACNGGGSGGSNPTFNLTYEAPGGSTFVGGNVNGLRFDPIILRNYTLGAGMAVTGVVTDGLGAPIGGVEISFARTATGSEIDSDTTNGSGVYNVALSAGTWYATLDAGSNLGTMSPAAMDVVGPGAFDFQFPAVVAITGTVFEMLGAVSPDAELRFEGAATGASASPDADGLGAYSVSLVPDTYSVVVEPVGNSADTQLKERFPSIVVSMAGVIDFTLTEGVQVSGIVFDDMGAPLLENTDIDIELPANSNFYAPDDVTTDNNDGSYTMGPVPFGSVTFEFDAPGDSGFPRQQITRTITGPMVETENFTLVAGFVLTGTILQDDGLTPEENVQIEPMPTDGSLEPEDDDTDALGTFEISLLPGTYNVVLTPETTNGQLPETRTITIMGDTTLDVTLTLGVIVTGTVTDSATMLPVEDVRVEILAEAGASDTTDSNGDYSFLAPEGTHTLVLVAEDGVLEYMALDPVADVVVALPGPMIVDITTQLATTGSTVISGIVYEPDGTTPIVGTEIFARSNSTNDILGRTFSAIGGAYVLVIP